MPSQIHHFPAEIEALPNFDGPFDAHRLQAAGCEVLFATYPAGTTIEPHTHPTNNVGVITKGQLILTVEDQVTIVRRRRVVSRAGRHRTRSAVRHRQRRDRVLVHPMRRRHVSGSQTVGA